MSYKYLGACSHNIWKLPWQSSGYDLVLSLPGAWVQFLVRELRSHKLPCAVKLKKKILVTRSKNGSSGFLTPGQCLSHHLNILLWPGGFFPIRIAEHLRHGPSPRSFGFSVYPVQLLLSAIYPGAPSPHTQAQTSTGTEKLVKCSLSMSYTIFHPVTATDRKCVV